MPWEVDFEPSARRAFRGLDRSVQQRILKSLAGLAADPRAAQNVKTLQGQPGYRLRVGDWRVIYTLKDDVLTVLVIRIAHRREAYR